jgi:hypothetical protein
MQLSQDYLQPTCNHPFRPGLFANKLKTLLGLSFHSLTGGCQKTHVRI